MKNTNMRTMEYFMLIGFILLDKTYNRCESGVVITTTPTEEDEFTTTELHIIGADAESETTAEFEAETIPSTESSNTEYTTCESEVESTPGSSEVQSTTENSEIQSTTENSEIQSTTEHSEIPSTTEHSEIPTSTENIELQSTTTEHSGYDIVITEASSDTITSEDSTDAGMATTTEPSPILSRTESPDPDLVDCCEWDGCEDKLGINSYCRFHDSSNSTYCDDRDSSRRKKREVVVQTTVSTTEFPGKPGKCWCRLGFHILRRNGPCVPIESPQPTRDSEVSVTPSDMQNSPNQETTTAEISECIMDPEISFGTTCRNERLNDSPGFNQDDSLTDQLTDPTTDPATDPTTPNEPEFCYNWTCLGQNCSLQATEQNITCQRTGPNCWVTKMCLLTETEYMFSCTDPCISVPSSPSVDCYSVSCTASTCNNQTSPVDEYTCFSAGCCCCVSITRLMMGVVFIVTNVWIYITPL